MQNIRNIRAFSQRTQRRVIIGNRLVVLDEVNRVIDLFLLP